MSSESVRNLGVIFHSQMTMAEHVNTVTRNCFYQLHQLRFIRRSLLPDTAKLLIHAFISSRVDYCNSLLFGATATVARKLQAVLNASARYISRLRRFDHISSVLKNELHWLPVEYHIRYKLALLVYKCLHGAGPTYLAERCTSLTETTLHHQLRSVAQGSLQQPRTRTHFGSRSIMSCGPEVRNSLPPAVHDVTLTLNNFKTRLKYYLFCTAYN